MLAPLELCAIMHSSVLEERMEKLTAPGNEETEGGGTGSTGF